MTAPEKTQAELDRDAVDYIARRIMESADAADVFGFGTEAFERIARASARAEGVSEAEAKRELARCRDPRPSLRAGYRARAEELEVLLDRFAPDWRREALS